MAPLACLPTVQLSAPFSHRPIRAHHILIFAGHDVLHPAFLSRPQDRTHRTNIALENLEAAIAQLGERQTEDLKVPSSIPGLGIRLLPACAVRRERRSQSPSFVICGRQR